MIYLYGVAGQLFRDQALTVAFSLLASLLVSFTLLPMLSSRFLHWDRENSLLPDDYQRNLTDTDISQKALFRRIIFPFHYAFQIMRKIFITTIRFFTIRLTAGWNNLVCKIQEFINPLFIVFDRIFARFAAIYEKSLLWALHHRGRVLTITLGVVGTALFLGFGLNRELIPQMDQGEFVIHLKLPVGTSLEATSAAVSAIEHYLLDLEDVETVFSTIPTTETLRC